MQHFRVVLQGRNGSGRRREATASGNQGRRLHEGLSQDLARFSAVPAWFLPEPVSVKVSRSVRRSLVPPDWELSVVGPADWERSRTSRWDRAARITLAAAGVVAGLAGTAGAEEAVLDPAAPVPRLPGAESSSLPGFMPTDHPPRLTLVEATPVRTGPSFDVPPLTDARGNPVLIAAFHSNSPQVPHTNTFTAHTNSLWSNHSNSPAGHSDAAWSNHSNSPPPDVIIPGGGETNPQHGQPHTNIVPGDFVF